MTSLLERPTRRRRSSASSALSRQLRCWRLRLQEQHDAVFDFAAGVQHGVLVVERRGLEQRVLDADAVDQSAVVQDVPAEARADRCR